MWVGSVGSVVTRLSRMGALVLSLACVQHGCSRVSSADPPAEVLRQFLSAMDDSASDEGALRIAYGLLSSQAQAGLTDRAKHARALSGQELEPWQMLAQGRFRLRFAPARARGMREKIEGDRATVTVVSGEGTDRAEVPLVREQGKWRVQLEIPPRATP